MPPAVAAHTGSIVIGRTLVYCREAKLSNQVRAVIDFAVGVMHDAAERISGSAKR